MDICLYFSTFKQNVKKNGEVFFLLHPKWMKCSHLTTVTVQDSATHWLLGCQSESLPPCTAFYVHGKINMGWLDQYVIQANVTNHLAVDRVALLLPHPVLSLAPMMLHSATYSAAATSSPVPSISEGPKKNTAFHICELRRKTVMYSWKFNMQVQGMVSKCFTM